MPSRREADQFMYGCLGFVLCMIGTAIFLIYGEDITEWLQGLIR
jgi:hypothetical protein